jgi:hypothetical protein
MFGTIRRHQSWLWFVIIGAMIIGLLWWTDQTTGRTSGGGRGGIAPQINGKTITPKTFGEAEREVRLLYFLNFRKWPEQDPERVRQIGFDLETESYLRLFRAGKAEEAGVRVSDQAIVDLVHRLLGDYPIDKFAKEVLEPNGLKVDDFERFVTRDAAIQQLSSVIGAAGRLVPPAEAEALYRRDNQELAGDIVFLPASNYLNKVVITNGALTNWYSQQMARYRVPDKIRASYVEFAKSNFLADADRELNSVSNLNIRLQEAYYKLGGTNYFKDTNGVPLTEENALAKIKEDERERMAMNFAARKANEFANKLYDKQPQRAENLDLVAKEAGLNVQVTMPFDIETGPTNLNVSPKFTEIAFKLNPTENPVSFQPIGGENGVYIIALKESIPGRPQSFEEVRDKVTDDYKRFSAFTLVRNDATNFIAKSTNAMAQGKTFEEVAQQLSLKAETLPPISRSTESLTNLEERLNVRQLKSIIFSLEPGKVSSYIPNPPEGGYVVYVRAKLPFDETKLRQELPKFMAELRYQKQNEIFGQWFRKEIEKEAWLREILEKSNKTRQQRAAS